MHAYTMFIKRNARSIRLYAAMTGVQQAIRLTRFAANTTAIGDTDDIARSALSSLITVHDHLATEYSEARVDARMRFIRADIEDGFTT